ncbi:hypothetical protein BH24ACT4_BH24ACT4_12550 [soil metagenome]
MKILDRLRGRPERLSCHQVAEVLQTYLDAELDEATVRKVAAHLDECRRCGLEAETYEALKLSLRRRPTTFDEEPVARLRALGEQLARGELDPDHISAP